MRARRRGFAPFLNWRGVDRPWEAHKRGTPARTVRQNVYMARSGVSETWQARISLEQAAQLRRDARLLGLDSRTDIVRAALDLLQRQAAEERMAQSVDAFYGEAEPPLPIGVRGR